jgi:NAD(P)-dependent dehydrogenase (short-subunit alcohol dehydrogenase family)
MLDSTPSSCPPVNLFRVFWRELTLIGTRVNYRSDFEEAVRLLASGGWGDAGDTAGVTVFLASSASDYVCGAIIPVDGGWLAR